MKLANSLKWMFNITLIGLCFLLVVAAKSVNRDGGTHRTIYQNFIPKTKVSIIGEDFYINGRPTLKGMKWKGRRMEGLLPNSRMVNGIFDDDNPESAHLWKYPDTQQWDPERNTTEFIQQMPAWKAHGLLAFNINFQGGSPQGYSQNQPWINSAFDEKGNLIQAYLNRLARILDKADELGMVVNVGLFYFGQDQHLKDEKAVIRAVDNAVNWLLSKKYKNILIEVANGIRHHDV